MPYEFPVIEHSDKKIFDNIYQITMEVHTGYKKEYNQEYMEDLLHEREYDTKIIRTFAWDQMIMYASKKHYD